MFLELQVDVQGSYIVHTLCYASFLLMQASEFAQTASFKQPLHLGKYEQGYTK